MQSIMLAFLLLSTPANTADPYSLPLKCELTQTADHFWFYREQLLYSSEQFAVFHNFKGRVVTQIDLKTGELIRTTYIGEPYDPKYQILLGSCHNPTHVLEMWELNQVPFDN